MWDKLFDKEHEPSDKQIAEFVATPLWDDLVDYMQQTYKTSPKASYSGCSMDGGLWKGWNVKFKKSGKALCTLYPKSGHFLMLIAIGEKETDEAEVLIPLCGEYVQDLWNKTKPSHFGKMLGLEITNEEILRDAKELIALRVVRKKKIKHTIRRKE
jgi:AraC family transcriptional regulator